MAKRLLIQIANNAEGWLVGFNIVPSALIRIPPNQRPSMNLGFYVIGRGKTKTEALQQAHKTAEEDIIAKAHGVASVLPPVDDRRGTGTASIPEIDYTFRSGETPGVKPTAIAVPSTPAAPAASIPKPVSNVSGTGLQPMKHTEGAIRPERGGGPIPANVPGATRIGNR